MKYFERQDEPEFLQQNAARWNQQWAELKTRNRGARFNWYKYDGKPVNQVLFPFLKSQTQEHCSYCDGFPLHLGDETIDHFCPKSISRFLRKAYSWKIYTVPVIVAKRLKWNSMTTIFYVQMPMVIRLTVISFTIIPATKLM